MQFIDSHFHIYAEQFDVDREDVMKRMADACVVKGIVPDIDHTTREKMFDICEQYPSILFPLVGLHPTEVKENWKAEIKLIEKYLSDKKVYGVGECGIDLFWDSTYKKEQTAAFEYQIGLARDCRLPICIHAREANAMSIKSIKQFPGIQGVFHCFSGTLDEAKELIDLGFKLGIGGILTYKKNELSTIIKEIDIHSLVLETDAPYLAPVPYRGKRNEAAYIPYIAKCLADLCGISEEEIASITTQNTEDLFCI